jgi:hypothetical protein
VYLVVESVDVIKMPRSLKQVTRSISFIEGGSSFWGNMGLSKTISLVFALLILNLLTMAQVQIFSN